MSGEILDRYEWNYDGKGGFITYEKSNIGLGDFMVFNCGPTFINEDKVKK